jgi:hypothetical protein
MRVLAVDFGTSNTVAALGVDGGAPRLVSIDGSPLVPSSVFLTDDGTLAVGRDADRQARIDPSRYEPNPKRRIDDGEILLGTAVLPVVRVIAAVLGRVGGEVRRQLGGQPDQVRLTHPARWGQRRKDTLLAAVNEAGLIGAGSEPVLVPEPVAAATHFATLSGSGLPDGGQLAVYDLGGGTFDVAIVRRRGADYEVIAEAGLADLGGLDFDHAIIEHIGRTHAIDTDPAAWQRLQYPVDATSRRLQRALYTDVRDGKEALSRYAHTDIALPPPFTDVHLTRAEFEELIRPNLQRSVDLLRSTISTAGTSPDRLAGIYLVGGSSRVPLVARLIQEGLGVTPTSLDQPETSVVTGALYLPLGAARPAAQGPAVPLTGAVPLGPGSGPLPQPGVTGGIPLGPGTGSVPQDRLTGGVPRAPVAGGPSAPPRAPTPLPNQSTPPGSAANRPAGLASNQPAPGGPRPPFAGYPAATTQPTPTGPVRPAPPTSTRPPMGSYGNGPVPPPSPVILPGGYSGGPPPGRPSSPPSSSNSKKWWFSGVGVVVAAAVAVVLVIVFTRGNGSPVADPTTHPSTTDVVPTSGGPTQTTGPTHSNSDVDLDSCLPKAELKAYVKPALDLMASCTKDKAFTDDASGPAIAVLNGGTVIFKDGTQVFFGEVGTGMLDTIRTSLLTQLASGLTQESQTTWSRGNKVTYSTDGGGSAIYWDITDSGVFALAIDPTDGLSELDTWWEANFDR